MIKTKVKNPVTRHGFGYVKCLYCGHEYTKLGISRHWSKCIKNPKRSK